MTVSFGDFSFDRERRQLLRSGQAVPLEAKAYELLDLLLSRRPTALSKAQIHAVLWPGTFVSESALARLVTVLRAACADDAHHPRFIRTVHGFGYAFCAEASESRATGLPAETGRQARDPLVNPPLLEDFDSPEPIDSLAVLPFVDLSQRKDQEYFCDGLAEELLKALTRVRGLRVASRTSSFQFKGTTVDIRDVGRRLGVRAILEGSVRRAGKRLRIMVQVTDVVKGFTLSSESYDRALADVFEVQEEIAELVVGALEVRLTEDERRVLGTLPTANLRAYDLYLRGQGLFHQLRVDTMLRAREMFEEAIVADPTFALAQVGLADVCSLLYTLCGRPPELLATASLASARALDLRPDLAEAHGARGLALALAQDVDGADREYRAAIALNPRLFEPHYWYGRVCLWQGRFAEAARLLERAARLRPEDYQSRSVLSMVYTSLGQHERAREAGVQAVAASTRHLETNPEDLRALCVTGTVLIRLGQIERGLEWVERARQLDPEGGSTLYSTACAYALAGCPDQALDALEQTLDKAFSNPDWIANDSDWASLREHPRFQALMARKR